MCASQENSSNSNSESNDANENSVSRPNSPIPAITSAEEILENYGANFKILECNSQVAELLTIIRDKYVKISCIYYWNM